MPAGPDQERAMADVLQVLAEARWPELFIPLAWPNLDLADFADFHYEFWAWWCSIEPGVSPESFVGCWFRGAAKSSLLQLALAITACVGLRSYAFYVGDTQDAVGDKIRFVGDLLRAPRIAAAFPLVASPYIDPGTGMATDWRAGRIRTASRFTLDGLGMDQAIRGRKVGEDRPDFIVIDDIESSTDTPYMTKKKEGILTRVIIPAGSRGDRAIVFIQNMIHPQSIMASMVKRKATFMTRRRMSGPVPQIRGLAYEVESTPTGPQFVITGGEPTWPAYAGIDVSQQEIEDEGIGAFLIEKQHEEDVAEGDKFPRGMWRYATTAPFGLVVARGWDLAGSTEESADYTVGALVGIDRTGGVWVLDVVRGQWSTDKVEERARELADLDREAFGRYTVAIEKQPAAAGKSWNERWVKEVMLGHKVELMPTNGGKEWRADGLSSMQRKGMVTLIEADWNGLFVSECALFPEYGRHDDQVDATVHAFNFLSGRTRKSKGSLASAARRQIG